MMITMNVIKLSAMNFLPFDMALLGSRISRGERKDGSFHATRACVTGL